MFVKVHGGEKEDFSETVNGGKDKRMPGEKSPEEWAEIQKRTNGEINEVAENVKSSDFVDELAIKQVTKNAVFSVANMMRGKSIGKLTENRKKFFKILDKIS